MDREVERRIIDQMRSSDDREKGFRTLMNTYQQTMYRCIRQWVDQHEDANDILQNTFIKVYRNIEGFRGDSALFSWMYRIAKNETYTFLRKRNKRAQSVDMQEFRNLRSSHSPVMDGDALLDELNRAVESLPERQQQVFELRYFQAMRYRDMAALLDLTEGALKASFHHAVEKVEDWIKEKAI